MGLFAPKHPKPVTPAPDLAAQAREAEYQRGVRERDAEAAREQADWDAQARRNAARCTNTDHWHCLSH